MAQELIDEIKRLKLTNAFYAGLIFGVLIAATLVSLWHLARWGMGI